MNILGLILNALGDVLVNADGTITNILHNLGRCDVVSDQVVDVTDQITKFVDEYASLLINHLGEFTQNNLLSEGLVPIARHIGAMGILLYIGYDMWPVIMGRKVPDFTVYLKPIIIATFIANWGGVINTLYAISGNGENAGLTKAGRDFYQYQWEQLRTVHSRIEVLRDSLAEAADKEVGRSGSEVVGTTNLIESEGKDPGSNTPVSTSETSDEEQSIIDKATDLFDRAWDQITDAITTKLEALGQILEDKIASFINSIQMSIFRIIQALIEFLCTLYLQTNFYGIMMIGQIGLGILALFGPIMLAMSIFEVWSNAWADWLMKFLALSTYGFLAYIVMGYTYSIVYYELLRQEQILVQTNAMITAHGFASVQDVFVKNFGILINWVIGLMTGGYCMRFVPELANMIFNTNAGGGAASSAAGAMKEGAKSTIKFVRGSK